MSTGRQSMSNTPLAVDQIRAEFPILSRSVHNKPLVYLDNAATTQRPQSVIEAVGHFYRHSNANVHRGVHQLSVEASEQFEAARAAVARFLGAPSEREIVFTRGTTEAINLVANSFLRPTIQAGDEILITHMEHHANIVPWQMLCEHTGAVLKVAPISTDGELLVDELSSMITERTRLVGVVHISNALGSVNPVAEICRMAQAQGVPVLIDGAQATPHTAIDVKALGCDFYCFSGHKMYGPTGIGGLWAKAAHLEQMPPWQGGGEMIRYVSFDETSYNDIPHKFEAGTPNVAGAIGLMAAIEFIERVGIDAIANHEQALLQYATEQLLQIDGLRIIGRAKEKGPVVSFVVDGAHANDIGTIVDHCGVAIRTGHHCAMPAMQFFNVPATARASFAAYNTHEEVDVFCDALKKAIGMLA